MFEVLWYGFTMDPKLKLKIGNTPWNEHSNHLNRYSLC